MILQSFPAEVTVSRWGAWQGGHVRRENVRKGVSPVTLFLHTFPSFQMTLEEILENLVRTVLGTRTNHSFLWANI